MSWKYVQYENGKYRTTDQGGGGGGGAGNDVYTGAAVPTSDIGEDGDLYVEIKNSFNYLRMTIYKNRNNTNVTQMSDIRFSDGNGNYYPFTGATITGNVSGATGETVDKLIDNNVDTKYCATSFTPSTSNPMIITITLGAAISLSDYPLFEYWTANDSPERDPVSFDVDISDDGANYTNILQIREATITTTRKVLGFQSSLFAGQIYYKSAGAWQKITI